tara:strand:- start:34625 stop:34903 length:279 start_codon:yes stop_codon:yes gene_type:complete
MVFYKTVDGQSTKVDSLDKADRVYLTSEMLKGVSQIDGQPNPDDTKLLALKAKIGFEGNIVRSKAGDGIVIHRNAPVEQPEFSIDSFLGAKA